MADRFQKNDLVVCIDTGWGGDVLCYGKTYTVLEASDNMVRIQFSETEPPDCFYNERFELLRPATYPYEGQHVSLYCPGCSNLIHIDTNETVVCETCGVSFKVSVTIQRV